MSGGGTHSWAAMEGMTAFNERLCLLTSVESCWSELDFMDLLTFDPNYSRRVLISFVFNHKIVIITQNSTRVMAQPQQLELTCGHPAVFHQQQGRARWARSRSEKKKNGTSLFMMEPDGNFRFQNKTPRETTDNNSAQWKIEESWNQQVEFLIPERLLQKIFRTFLRSKKSVPTLSRATLTPFYITPGQTFKQEHDFRFFLKRSHGRRSRNNEEWGKNRGTVCAPVWEMTLCQRHFDNVWNKVNHVWQLRLSAEKKVSQK